jgi:hypothetical protein
MGREEYSRMQFNLKLRKIRSKIDAESEDRYLELRF